MNAFIGSPIEKNLRRIEVDSRGTQGFDKGLFPVLQALFPLQFVSISEKESRSSEPALTTFQAQANPGGRVILNSPPPVQPLGQETLANIDVWFATSPEVPMPFRGRRVTVKANTSIVSLALENHERVLAMSSCGPLWTLSEQAGETRYRTALPLPQISSDAGFCDFFNGERFLEALPLMEFLRKTFGDSNYQAPPLRAAYIIDDPNLHWPRYGWVDYREIASHARKENYHVAFATIPMDTWFTHKPTAEIFRANSERLSLLVHGNNHGKRELAARYSDDERDRLLVQALWRIKRLEQTANVPVCRVMVPPHGACSSAMLAALARNGFESACISSGSLRAFNPDKPWTRTLGFYPSEIIEGCPVLPRWGLTGSVENTLLIAAYLGRPLILRGHHQDLKDGPDVLATYASFINGLGDVRWSSLSSLSQMSYLWRTAGARLLVKPLGKKISIQAPDTTTALVIDAAEAQPWQVRSENGSVQMVPPGHSLSLTDGMQGKLLIESLGPQRPATSPENLGRTNARLICRRILAEARDRLLA